MTDRHQKALTILRWIIAFTMLSTVLHYTHNFVRIDDYPKSDQISNTFIQVAILVSWPLLTAIGLYGYREYARRDYRTAHAALLTYSFIGWITLGHFTSGNPDIPPFFYATIFTDAIAAAALTAFVIWSSRSVATATAARAGQ
jgi:hypothetical protein